MVQVIHVFYIIDKEMIIQWKQSYFPFIQYLEVYYLSSTHQLDFNNTVC
jgi:hypothetical protein